MTFLTRSSTIFLSHFKEAQFYLIDLKKIQNLEVLQAKKLLDKESLNKANKHIFREDRQKKILIYAFLRFYLASLTGQKASKIRLLRDSYGKPYIKGLPIHFNISHTKQYAVLAFHPCLPIGVDIEQVRNIPDILTVADLFMHQHEKRQLIDSKDPLNYFFSLWCAKEAFLKVTSISFDQLPNWHLDIGLNHDNKPFMSLKHNIYLYKEKVKSHKLAVCVENRKIINSKGQK